MVIIFDEKSWKARAWEYSLCESLVKMNKQWNAGKSSKLS